MKENVISSYSSEVYKKLFEPSLPQIPDTNITTQDSNVSITLNPSVTTVDSIPSITCKKTLDENSLQTIESLIDDVFNQTIILQEDLQNCSHEDALMTPEIIKKAIQKKPYEDFIPTILLQLDRSLKNINYDVLQKLLGQDAVILNVESYNTNIQNGFLSIEDYEPYANKIPASLQIALLSFDHFDSDIKSKLKDSFLELFNELKKNQASIGKICKNPDIIIPDIEHIKSVFRRPSNKLFH